VAHSIFMVIFSLDPRTTLLRHYEHKVSDQIGLRHARVDIVFLQQRESHFVRNMETEMCILPNDQGKRTERRRARDSL